jgi:hypothetical protein
LCRNDDVTHLELDYKIESEHPNTFSREQVIKEVVGDQKAIKAHDGNAELLTDVSNFGLACFGGKWGVIAAATTFALDTMHVNDSFGQQALEGAGGFVVGRWAGKMSANALQMSNPLLGGALAAVPYIGFRNLYHSAWPNEGYGQAPDPYKMMGMPVVVVRVPEQAPIVKPVTGPWSTSPLNLRD